MPSTTPSRAKILLVAPLIVLLALLLTWPITRAHLQAVALLDLVAGTPLSPSLEHMVASPVTTQVIFLPGNIRARLYTPVDHPHAPGVVVLHGVHYLGMDEPRLIAFAHGLSACGLRVLTPELPGIRDYHINEDSISVIGGATQWFAQQTGHPVGVMGLSFSGGLALIAATEPQYAGSFKFLVAIGAQNSMQRVAGYYRTGRALRPDGSYEVLPPHEYGTLVLEYEHLEDFLPAADIPAIRSVLRAHLYEDPAAEKQAMLQLTPAQRAEALDLMQARSPQTQHRLTAQEQDRALEMDALSPTGKIAALTTPVFLLHGEADNIIPSAESLWMAAELRPQTLKELLISPIISHVGMENSTAPAWLIRGRDRWRLVHFFARVLQTAEAPTLLKMSAQP